MTQNKVIHRKNNCLAQLGGWNTTDFSSQDILWPKHGITIKNACGSTTD